MIKGFRYETILFMTSLQYSNHFREYFIKNSEKAIAFYVLPRKGKIKNFVEVYEKGVKTKMRKLYSPGNIFLWHGFLYVHYITILFQYTKKGEKIYFINYLFSLFFLGKFIQTFRQIEFVFWIGDYWPMNDLSIRIYRWFMHFYHKRVPYAFYQTDRINIKMNGKVVDTEMKKKIIPAVDPPHINYTKKVTDAVTLCFIGVLVPWQGIDVLLEVVAKNPHIRLRLIGTGNPELVEKYKNIIKGYEIQERVYFPNTFIYGDTLKKEIANSHIGIALYDVDPLNVTYYGDPAKIKQYMEFGLPIIMTDAAEAASNVKKFKAGIVVERSVESINKAIEDIRKNYSFYLHNLDKYNHWLDYRTYYVEKFKFLEREK